VTGPYEPPRLSGPRPAGQLAGIKAWLAAERAPKPYPATKRATSFLPDEWIDWLIGEAENAQARVDNMAARLGRQRAANATMQRETDSARGTARHEARAAQQAQAEVQRLRGRLGELEGALIVAGAALEACHGPWRPAGGRTGQPCPEPSCPACWRQEEQEEGAREKARLALEVIDHAVALGRGE
jgi:hypothetical protein